MSKIHMLNGNNSNSFTDIPSLPNNLVLQTITQAKVNEWNKKIGEKELNSALDSINNKISSINRDIQTLNSADEVHTADIKTLKAKLNELNLALGDIIDTTFENNNYLSNIAQNIGKINEFINSGYTDAIINLNKRLDGKADSYIQSTPPHPEYRNVADNNNYNVWVGDLWRNPKENKDYKYVKIEINPNAYSYYWEEQTGAIPDGLFDMIDGKSSIYFSKPSSYNARDCWILESDDVHPPNKMGTLLFANATRKMYVASDWIDLMQYVTKNDYENYIKKINDFINKTYNNEIKNLNDKIDGKADSFVQETPPHPEYFGIEEKTQYDGWIGDLWRKSSTGADYRYLRRQLSNGNYDYYWELQTTSIPDDLFDKIDGKASIYFTKPTSYSKRDCWILENDSVHYPNKKGTILFANRSNTVYNPDDWVDLLSYVTDDDYDVIKSKLENFINNTYNDEIKDINNKIDGKANSYVQEYPPHDEYLNVEQTSEYDGWLGDIWRKISSGEDFKYVRIKNVDGTYSYRWEAQSASIPDSLFDLIDGKATIFFSKPDSYSARDCWILENDTVHPPNKKGTMLFSIKDNDHYDATDWVDLISYITRGEYEDYKKEVENWINNTYTEEIKNINSKIDNKADSYVQEDKPHPEYNNIAENTEYNGWLGDIWRKISSGADYKYLRSQNKDGTFNYYWELQTTTIPDDIFDKIDGKSSIYFSKPTSYSIHDCWILENDSVHPPHKKGTLLFANKSNSVYDADDWIDLVSYVTEDKHNEIVTRLNEFINYTYTDEIKRINSKIDNKANSYVQEARPHEEYYNVTQNITYDGWLGDIWRKISSGEDFKYVRVQGTSSNTYTYKWEAQSMSVPDSLYDLIDGKATIYFSRPDSYSIRDCWILESDEIHPPNKKGEMLFAKGGNTSYNSADWVDLLSYIDKTQYDDLVNRVNTFINNTYTNDIKDINNKIDNKANSYVQENSPHAQYTTSSKVTEYEGWIGDIWRKPSTSEDYKYVRVDNPNGKYTYKWELQTTKIPDELYDKIDGKASIYFSKPSSYFAHDCWILENDTVYPPYLKGTLLFSNYDNTTYDASDWVDLVNYINKTDYNEGINNVTKKYEELSDRFSWLVTNGSSSSSLIITDKLIQAIATSNIQLSAKKILINGLLEGVGWRVDEEGNFVVNDLNIEGTLTCQNFSTENLVGATIGRVLDSDQDYYASSSNSITDILDDIPYNLNGYKVNIYVTENLTEDITLRKHINGSIKIFMCGYPLYGYIHTMHNNSIYEIYGGSSESDSTKAKIMPYTGYVLNSYVYTILCSYSPNIYLKNLIIYGDKSNTANNVGVGGTQKSDIIMNNVSFIGCKSNCRTYSLTRVHCDSSTGRASGVGWYAGTGSRISFGVGTQAGGSTNNTDTGSNGQVLSSGVTFSSSADSGSNNNTGGTNSTVKSVTYYPKYSDNYRSTHYYSWRKDGVAKQGRWSKNGAESGSCNGYFFFGNQFSELKGCNITKVVITLSRKSGVGNSASCNHPIYYHTYTGRPSSNPSMQSCNASVNMAWGETDSATITNSNVLTGIANGTVKGFGIKSTYDSSHYSGISTCKVRIYYTGEIED